MTEIRIITAGVLLGLIVLLGWKINDWRIKANQLDTVAESANQANTNTEGATNAASNAITETQRVDIVITQSRQGVMERYYELRNQDPEVAIFGSTDIPVSMRELAKARRLERESLASDGAGRASASPRETTQR